MPLVFLVEPSTVTKLFAFASTVDCVLVSVTPERFATNLPFSTLMVLLSTFTPKVYFFVPLLLLLSVKVKPVPFATLACVLVSFALIVYTPPVSLTVTLLPALMPATVALMVILETPFASVVGVTVMPLPDAILTLSPGLTKPTLLPFACKIQPLALIASTTFLVFTKYLPSPSVVQGLPSFAFSPFLILETLALNLKSLPERTTSMVSVSEKETVSPPLTD